MSIPAAPVRTFPTGEPAVPGGLSPVFHKVRILAGSGRHLLHQVRILAVPGGTFSIRCASGRSRAELRTGSR